jgi:hypothetical protein
MDRVTKENFGPLQPEHPWTRRDGIKVDLESKETKQVLLCSVPILHEGHWYWLLANKSTYVFR